ncbi:MAG: FAD-binding oxidoreductase [archaeon YNP-WB-040]|jgi:glycolate oxidase|nr:FAD-binding oxidoreductase [Candidatus Culexarchaeum yellowstonense]
MRGVSELCLSKLRSIFGDRIIIDEEILKQYEEDQSYIKGKPSLAVIPETSEEVEKLVEVAKEFRIPLIPRGGGTSLSGGSVPIFGGIIVDFRRMNRILEFDLNNLQVLVEPGVIYDNLNDFLSKYNLFLPPNPATGDQCTIGGMLAENSAGPRSYKYGTIKNWVLGLEVITSSVGKVWIGSRTKKWVSAYNLVSLIVGSEGTLGIITKALLRVAPKPQYRIGVSISSNNLENAGEIIVALTKLNIDISAIELMDDITIAAINKAYNASLPESDAIILLEIEAFSSNDMDNKLEALASYLKNLGIPDENVHVYYNADEMWRKRKLAGESLEKVYGGRIDEDIIVPVSLLPKTIMEIKSLSSKFNVNIAVFGHAGDGHLHPSILVPKEKSLTPETEKIKENIFKIAVKNNGALSGEHGIGIAKKQYLPLEIDANTLKLLSIIKQTLDPYNIMNPGKKI